ncbi:hypothetical protein [Streptomyces noursei]|uniref:hypothetical protein n=1 Tax=Streptomyces noursei TaxID=1971 RepID=UPI003819ABEF
MGQALDACARRLEDAQRREVWDAGRRAALVPDEPTDHLDDGAAAFLAEQSRALPGASWRPVTTAGCGGAGRAARSG